MASKNRKKSFPKSYYEGCAEPTWTAVAEGFRQEATAASGRVADPLLAAALRDIALETGAGRREAEGRGHRPLRRGRNDELLHETDMAGKPGGDGFTAADMFNRRAEPGSRTKAYKNNGRQKRVRNDKKSRSRRAYGRCKSNPW